MIEMALKLLFLSQNHKNRPATRGSAPQAPIGDTFELQQFGQHGA